MRGVGQGTADAEGTRSSSARPVLEEPSSLPHRGSDARSELGRPHFFLEFLALFEENDSIDGEQPGGVNRSAEPLAGPGGDPRGRVTKPPAFGVPTGSAGGWGIEEFKESMHRRNIVQEPDHGLLGRSWLIALIAVARTKSVLVPDGNAGDHQ